MSWPRRRFPFSCAWKLRGGNIGLIYVNPGVNHIPQGCCAQSPWTPFKGVFPWVALPLGLFVLALSLVLPLAQAQGAGEQFRRHRLPLLTELADVYAFDLDGDGGKELLVVELDRGRPKAIPHLRVFNRVINGLVTDTPGRQDAGYQLLSDLPLALPANLAMVAAGHDNSTALGAGAMTNLPNQIVFGTSEQTYRAPGIVSDRSKNRQDGSRIECVTTDQAGNLAAAGCPLDGPVNEGVAMAMAMPGLWILPDSKSIAIAAGGGYFEGQGAVGGSIAGRIGSHVYVSASGAYGVEHQQYGARGGIALAW